MIEEAQQRMDSDQPVKCGIKRTRKRQIQKAKFMDHGSYEWSQWWRKPYGKFRRNATRYSKRK
ncbi:hypothetical protein [Limosilactobacillus coleohominis]|uniref:hypothetical protein n=1 Tax=Limosilactobacillus coleohominis TaxID=181675 RepID=UPI002A90AD86|nr:hypothetical protein [Limosilactobacillus coleohominis]MDY5628869.1 hypothetical protein [Limosilactobacillus coleohominis]